MTRQTSTPRLYGVFSPVHRRKYQISPYFPNDRRIGTRFLRLVSRSRGHTTPYTILHASRSRDAYTAIIMISTHAINSRFRRFLALPRPGSRVLTHHTLCRDRIFICDWTNPGRRREHALIASTTPMDDDTFRLFPISTVFKAQRPFPTFLPSRTTRGTHDGSRGREDDFFF